MTANFSVPADFKVKYLQRKNEELGICRTHVESRRFEMIRTMAHQMKGNAKNFEFPLLAELAIQLEDAANAENPLQAKLVLADIQKAVDGLLNRLAGPHH